MQELDDTWNEWKLITGSSVEGFENNLSSALNQPSPNNFDFCIIPTIGRLETVYDSDMGRVIYSILVICQS